MTVPTINNVQSLNGEPTIQIGGTTAMTNDFHTLIMSNNSGATRTYGDVVVTDVTGCLATTTTTAGDTKVIGVVSQQPKTTYASGATMPVVVKGVARVNVTTNTVVATNYLAASATAAAASTTTTGVVGVTFAIALESSTSTDTNNTIRAKLV